MKSETIEKTLNDLFDDPDNKKWFVEQVLLMESKHFNQIQKVY